MDFYPTWIYESLINDNLPWNLGKKMTFDEFHKKYTLHDSNWIGVYGDISHDSTYVLAIQWDTCWLPDEMVEKTAEVLKWPLLFVKIHKVKNISMFDYNDIGGIQRTIGNSEIVKIDDKNLLDIEDVYGGSVQIEFSGELIFLCLDTGKSIIDI